MDVASFSLRLGTGRHSLAGSAPAAHPPTQRVLGFCTQKALIADVEVQSANRVQTALDRLARKE